MANFDLLGLQKEDLEWYQMFTRTVIVFVIAIAFIRLAGIRTFGTKTPFDVVVSITLGALLSRCISGHYPFFSTLFTAMFLAVLHRVIAFIAYKNSFFRRMVEGKAELLYDNGQKIEKNMRRNCISEQDIHKALHENNVDALNKVKAMYLEPDGKISLIKKEE